MRTRIAATALAGMSKKRQRRWLPNETIIRMGRKTTFRGRKTEAERPVIVVNEATQNREEKPENAGTSESEIDQVLADSFPASDAPPWTLGVTSARSTGIRHKRERT